MACAGYVWHVLPKETFVTTPYGCAGYLWHSIAS